MFDVALIVDILVDAFDTKTLAVFIDTIFGFG